jgi:hypothetical protein
MNRLLISAAVIAAAWPNQALSQVNISGQLNGSKWCTYDKANSLASINYLGNVNYVSSGNTCMSLDKVGKKGGWKIGFEWWNPESKIRVKEYALASSVTPKILSYQEAKSADDRRAPYASQTPGTRGSGYVHFIDSKTLRLSQLGRRANGDVTLLVYYLERVNAFPKLNIPLTFPSIQPN